MQELEPLAHINYRTHSVHISKDISSGSIHCFKYDRSHCDYSVFKEDEYESCSDYILSPLPDMQWGFIEDNV
jgi:hypothetical protein